jgi:salicylate hydroxylase
MRLARGRHRHYRRAVQSLRVIVAGAGIGGLALALGLLRAGHRVRVFERARQLGEVGAGLTITPNGSHVLHALGVWPAVVRLAVIPAHVDVRNGVTGERIALRRLGDALRARFGADQCLVHRADLHDVLREAVLSIDPAAISVSDGFEALAVNGAGGVRARFAASGEVDADLLVGADGVRSGVRPALFGPEAPTFAGYVAWRGLAPVSAVPARLLEHASCLYTGPRNLLLRYLVRGGELVNVACIGGSDAWTAEGWSTGASHDEVLGLLAGWHPDVHALVRAIPAASLFKWGLFSRRSLGRWSVGRATLLGDAAHPMLPFLGQGAVMALEDAMLLVRALAAAEDVPSALATYERARLPRANEVMRLSAENGHRLVPRSVAEYDPGSHMSPASLGLVDYDPVTVPLPAG